MNMFKGVQNFEPEHLFLLQLSVALASIAILFIILVFVKRFRKILLDQEKEWFLGKVVSLLGSMVIVKRNRLQWRRDIKQLVSLIGRSAFKRQIVINHLRHLKNDLGGDSAFLIMDLYRDLNLVEHSRNKVTSRNWKKQAEGILELASMNYYYVNIFKSLLSKTKNKTVRNELVLAMVSLDIKEPFKGLELINFELNGWLKLNIHQRLTQFAAADLPDFGKWFHHTQEDVALFFISLTQLFRQTSSTSALAAALQGRKAIAVAALKTLTQLEEFGYAREVAAMITAHWICAETSLAILGYLEHATDLHLVSSLVDRYRFHPDYAVQQKAISILAKFNAPASDDLFDNLNSITYGISS